MKRKCYRQRFIFQVLLVTLFTFSIIIIDVQSAFAHFSIHSRDEDPITVEQIDSLIALPSYYDDSYRYVDTLGTHGGVYSGGFIDTYLGETQIMLPIPKETFLINNTEINLDPTSTGGPLYWMAQAMGQEIFNIDKQFMIAIGLKETFAGCSGASYVGVNSDGAYGAFEVESYTFLGRAIAYPKFYPDYTTELESVEELTSFVNNVMSAQDFAAEYMGATETPINSGYIVSSFVNGGLSFGYIYDLLLYSEDLCWLEVVEHCIDPFVGVCTMAPLYNLGMNSGAESPIHVTNYESLLDDPDACDRFVSGNSAYKDNILIAVEALIGASKQSLTDQSVQLWDTYITLAELETFFFGDNGSVSSQGNGGLCKHFTVDRQQLWNDVQAAFNKLSPHWSQSPAAISYRYDFLTLLRVIKGSFNCSRPDPHGWEPQNWIEQNSQVGGCATTPLGDDDKNVNLTLNNTIIKSYSFSSSIQFDVGVTGGDTDLKVELFNTKGKKIAVLYNGIVNDKNRVKTITIDKKLYPAGIYFVNVQAGVYKKTLKVYILN